MKKIFFITSLFITAFFCSCMSERKARNNAKDFYLKHPAELAGECVEKFPPIIEMKPGKPVIIPGDTVLIPGDSIPCPPATRGQTVKVANPGTVLIRDTLKIVDTVFRENTARVVSLQYRLDTTAAAVAVIRGNLQDMTDRRDYWKASARSRLYLVVGLCLFVAVGIYLKIRKIV